MTERASSLVLYAPKSLCRQRLIQFSGPSEMQSATDQISATPGSPIASVASSIRFGNYPTRLKDIVRSRWLVVRPTYRCSAAKARGSAEREQRPSSVATPCWPAAVQWLAGPSQNLNIAYELRPESIRLVLEIKSSLKIKPKARGIAKEAAQSESGVGGNCAFAVNDLVDTSSGHAQALRQPVLS